MQTNIIVGNIFSLLAAICIGVSVVKKNKTDLIWWQIFDVVFCIFSNISLCAYAALSTNSISLIRNILAYQNKLTKFITFILTILCVVVGLWVNNLAIIGILPITASASYTIFLYITKNEQQMRWALALNLLLWLIHDLYVQAYPLAFTDAILSVWTLVQIIRNSKL